MEITQYIIFILASFSGTLFGIAISKICSEEVLEVSNYLINITPLLVPITLGILIYKSSIILAIIGTIILIVMLILLKNKYNPKILYISSGLLIYLATRFDKSTIITIGVIIFLYSIFMITIEISNLKDYESRNKKNINKTNLTIIRKIINKYSYFLLVAVLSYIIFEYLLKL